MSIKNKNQLTATDKLGEVALQAGLVIMTAAATLGMMELPDHQGGRIIVPNQPSFAMATRNVEATGNNQLRREREETAPHYISYSVVQRTPGRSGKV